LVYKGFKPEEEGLREALCTLGNGYFCTRGAGCESSDDGVHYPGTYLAGGYNRLKSEVAGEVIENEDLVNFPNWLPLNFRIADGEWFSLNSVKVTDYRQALDTQRGVLQRVIVFTDGQGRRTRVETCRLVHMSEPHFAALELQLIPENWSGKVDFRSALDGQVINNNVERYSDLSSRHLEPLDARAVNDETICLKVQTNQSKIQMGQAARTRVYKDGEPESLDRDVIEEEGYVAQEFTVRASQHSTIRVEKVVAVYTSRDPAITEPLLEACKWVDRADSFKDLLSSHEKAWRSLWHRFDIGFEHEDREDSERMGEIMHLYIFHLLQTTSINTMTMDLDAGIPPRGWHGEAYRGHILWDELFIFPLIHFQLPEITRSVLMYRYRRLDEARANAKKAGYDGAMYPWQSGSNGREESQEIHLNPKSGNWIPDNSNLQRHVNSAVAYNVYRYFQVTGDMEFVAFYGAEMVLEIARFWASISTYNPSLDRYEILGVMGPDEFHEAYPDADTPGLNNNAYTNIMAVWVLNCARSLLKLLPEDAEREVRKKLSITDEEVDKWRDISHRMRIAFHDDGIISQFEGYGDLEEFDWDGYREKYGNIQRLDRILEAEGDSPNRYKVSKQADVLMLFYLFSAEEIEEIFEQLGYEFEYETIPENSHYYLERSSHGSTLSWVVHSWVLSRSHREQSWEMFREALRSDVADIQGGTTPEGIHLGAMAGTIDLLQRGYTGIVTRHGVLWFNPCLPEGVKRLRMHIRYRGHPLDVELTPEKLRITSRPSSQRPIRIGFDHEVHELEEDSFKEFALE
jgi:alpha,alpha-trehalase